eukprot:CAMPEP_0174819736 /NCGR_PEP_ID=MMETSP1107-20130205/3155_1 /TAXON_ID=36770 /ORGANISM="Paraphysomonas vestita, Strain GFlagA" /LENGTH=89 /DNA_ID=CAMNT_0016033803 /DNA_START=694 /DNA_END=960 /DNA_ORIENTATION=+
MTSGVRYGLFFCDTIGSTEKKEEDKVENETEEEEYYENDESNDEVKKVKKDLSYLLNESIRMFEFYKKSVKVIENTTEEDLYLIEDKYK